MLLSFSNLGTSIPIAKTFQSYNPPRPKKISKKCQRAPLGTRNITIHARWASSGIPPTRIRRLRPPNKEANATSYWTGLEVMYDSPAQQCNFINATPLQPCQLRDPGRYFIENQENTTRKELIRAEVNDANSLFSLLLSSVQSEFLNHYRQKHQSHIHQHQELLLHIICELEAVARNDILSHQKSRNYKTFGPDQTSPERIVLAFAIKQNSYNKAFQLAWRQMSQCNGGFIDPFHHTEITMTNSLRMQGLLQGPVIKHYPVKLPTKSWFSRVEQEAAEHALENQMANVLWSLAQQLSSAEELSYPSSELPPLQDLCLNNTCIFESMSRSIMELQLLKERKQLTGSEQQIHLTSHMLCLHEQFLECCKRKWDLL